MVSAAVTAAVSAVVSPAGAALGLLADSAWGEPPAALHPVAGFGAVMAGVESRLYRDHRGVGVLHALAGLGLGAGVGAGLQEAVGRVLATAAATWLAVAGRELGRVADEIGGHLAQGDLDAARATLPALVGRDPSGLDESGVARAVIESVAENTVDAVVAPALWAAGFGAPGALGYRAVNTMDAMIGHRNERYGRYGWAAARLDDLANLVPARATAGLVALVRPGRAGVVWRTVRRDAGQHPSPNAGVAEAAFAGALGLCLGGTNRYGGRMEERGRLGEGRPPQGVDIAEAIRLGRHVTWALAALLATGGLGAGGLGGGRPGAVGAARAASWLR